MFAWARRAHSNHSRTRAHGSDVQHEHLVLAQLGYFALLLSTLRHRKICLAMEFSNLSPEAEQGTHIAQQMSGKEHAMDPKDNNDKQCYTSCHVYRCRCQQNQPHRFAVSQLRASLCLSCINKWVRHPLPASIQEYSDVCMLAAGHVPVS